MFLRHILAVLSLSPATILVWRRTIEEVVEEKHNNNNNKERSGEDKTEAGEGSLCIAQTHSKVSLLLSRWV